MCRAAADHPTPTLPSQSCQMSCVETWTCSRPTTSPASPPPCSATRSGTATTSGAWPGPPSFAGALSYSARGGLEGWGWKGGEGEGGGDGAIQASVPTSLPDGGGSAVAGGTSPPSSLRAHATSARPHGTQCRGPGMLLAPLAAGQLSSLGFDIKPLPAELLEEGCQLEPGRFELPEVRWLGDQGAGRQGIGCASTQVVAARRRRRPALPRPHASSCVPLRIRRPSRHGRGALAHRLTRASPWCPP